MSTFKPLAIIALVSGIAIAALIGVYMLIRGDEYRLESLYGVSLDASSDDRESMTGYDTLVLDASYFTADDLAYFRDNGTSRIYSYLNVGALEDFRDFFSDYQGLILSAYEGWEGEYWVRAYDGNWKQHVYDTAAEYVSMGADGVFLDNFDVYYNYPTDEMYSGLLEIIETLYDNGIPVIINGGDLFVTRLLDEQGADRASMLISAVNQESIFSGEPDFCEKYLTTDSLGDVNDMPDSVSYYTEYLSNCASAGMDRFIIEYTTDDTVIGAVHKYCDETGTVAFIASDSLLSAN